MTKNVQMLALLMLVLCGCSSKVESAFKSGCASSGASSSVCSCVYKKMAPDLEQVDKDVNYMNSDKFQRAYIKAAKDCSAE